MIFVPGALAVSIGALLLYLASPNQRLRTREKGRRSTAWAGLVLVLAGIAALLIWAGPATAIFIALTFAMLVWTFVPVAAAWWRRPRGGA